MSLIISHWIEYDEKITFNKEDESRTKSTKYAQYNWLSRLLLVQCPLGVTHSQSAVDGQKLKFLEEGNMHDDDDDFVFIHANSKHTLTISIAQACEKKNTTK